MRVVVDTNVLISGIFFSGPPYKIIQAWRCGKLVIVFSESIHEEYHRVSDELSAQFSDIDASPFLVLLIAHGELVNAPDLTGQVCADPDDDKFLACAISGKCKTIVSGDKELLKVDGYRGINVLKPREFVDKHLSA